MFDMLAIWLMSVASYSWRKSGRFP